MVILTVLAIRTVIGFTLSAKVMHFLHKVVRVFGAPFSMYLIDLVLSVHLIYPLSYPLLFTLLIDMVRAIPFALI
jgi:hypothetical protein